MEFITGIKQAILRVEGFTSEKERKDYNILCKDIENYLNVFDREIKVKIILYVYEYGETEHYFKLLELAHKTRPYFINEFKKKKYNF